jgi:hypothetical protein
MEAGIIYILNRTPARRKFQTDPLQLALAFFPNFDYYELVKLRFTTMMKNAMAIL